MYNYGRFLNHILLYFSYDKILIKFSRVINFQLICAVKFKRFVFFYKQTIFLYENRYNELRNIAETANSIPAN